MTTPGAVVASGVTRGTCGSPNRRPAGAGSGGRPPDGWSGAFLVQDKRLLVGFLGQLQPDEQPGQDDQRDHDQGAEGDAERHRDSLESLHGRYLRTGMLGPWGPAVVGYFFLSAGAPLAATRVSRSAGPPAIIDSTSSLVNSDRTCLLPVWDDIRSRTTKAPSCSKKKVSFGFCSSM